MFEFDIDKDVLDEKKKKKQELQQRYREQVNKNKEKQKGKVKEAPIDWKIKYEGEKKKRKELQKQLKVQEKKKQEAITKQKEWQEKVIVEKQKKDAYFNKAKIKNHTIHQLNQKVRKLESENQLITNKYVNLQSRMEKKNNEFMKKNPEKFMKLNQQLRTQNEELRQQVKKMQMKLNISNTIKRGEEQEHYKTEIRSLRERNKGLSERIKTYQDVHQPDNLLTVLKDMITVENLPHFYQNRQNRLEQLKERIDDLKQEQERKKYKVPKSIRKLEQEYTEENLKMGFITKHESSWYFFDVASYEEGNYEMFEVVGNTSNHKFKQDLPVKCVIRENGTASVTEVYENHEIPERISKMFKPKEKDEKKEKKTYETFGEAKVLIIGSRNLAEYEQRLNRHGIEVEIHNPFEENYHRLAGKFKSADVVVVCTSHISHAVMNHIDKKHPKVEMIERDNEEWIAVRVKFAMQKLNLLSEESLKTS